MNAFNPCRMGALNLLPVDFPEYANRNTNKHLCLKTILPEIKIVSPLGSFLSATILYISKHIYSYLYNRWLST